MTLEEYNTVIKKFPFLELQDDSVSAYIGYEIIAIPDIFCNEIREVAVYNKVVTGNDDDEFTTDEYVHEITKTPDELFDSLFKLVEPYNKWKKNKRFALIEEL